MDLTTLLKFLAKGREGIDLEDPEQAELNRIAEKGMSKQYYDNPPAFNNDTPIPFLKPEPPAPGNDIYLPSDMGPTYMPEEDVNNPFYDRQDPEYRRKKMLQRLALGFQDQQASQVQEPRFLASNLYDSGS